MLVIWKYVPLTEVIPNNPSYVNYGGRGITICDRWLIFENFLCDMGLKPSSDLSIERVNNDGNYEPGNCKWGTQTEQNKNRRLSPLNTSGYRGVSFDSVEGLYHAYISVDGRLIKLGRFRDPVAAATARDKAAIKYFGPEYHHLNLLEVSK
jgi:hypothetical protein